MARSDWDISGIIIYIDDDDNCYDIYEYAERISKYIPISFIVELLTFSEQRFVDMLNGPINSKSRLITSAEEEYRQGNWDFSKYNVFYLENDLTVELADFEYWLDDNYEFLKENRVKQRESDSLLVPEHILPPLESYFSEGEDAQARDTYLATGMNLAAEIEKEASPASPHDEESFPAEYENHGIFTLVAKCVWERTPVEEIMRLLNDEEFLTQKENGYFFHPSPKGKTVEALRSYTKYRLAPQKKGW